LNVERPVIRSDGLCKRDYIHAEDGVGAYLLLAEQLAGRPELRGSAFNFSNEEPTTVLEMVQRITRLMGSTLEPEVRNEATHEIRHQYLNAARARQELGWRPLYSLDRGLESTIQWYREALTENGRGARAA
jgi:CDP-glucose 4,6-dehydratase